MQIKVQTLLPWSGLPEIRPSLTLMDCYCTVVQANASCGKQILDDEDPFAISWDKFRRRLDVEFITEQWKKNKTLDFASLKQGDMTVTEYYLKFTQLFMWHQTILLQPVCSDVII